MPAEALTPLKVTTKLVSTVDSVQFDEQVTPTGILVLVLPFFLSFLQNLAIVTLILPIESIPTEGVSTSVKFELYVTFPGISPALTALNTLGANVTVVFATSTGVFPVSIASDTCTATLLTTGLTTLLIASVSKVSVEFVENILLKVIVELLVSTIQLAQVACVRVKLGR